MTEGDGKEEIGPRARWAIAAFLALLVAARLAVLFGSTHIGHFFEERGGNFAVQILEGRPLPLGYARPHAHQGSSAIESLLAVPLYAVLGPSGTWLKLMMLSLSAILLLALLVVAAREEGIVAAVVTGALFVFSPTMFVSYTFDSVGGSYWGCTMNAVMLLLAIGAFRWGKRGWIPAWAFCLGFGVFLHTTCLLMAAFTLIVGVAHGLLRLGRRDLVVAAACLAAGLSPFFVFGLGIGKDDNVITMVKEAFITMDFSEIKARSEDALRLEGAAKAWSLVALDVPHALSYRIWPAGGYVHWAVLLVAIAWGAFLDRRVAASCLASLRPGSPAGARPPAAFVVAGFLAFYAVLYVVSDITPPVPGRWVFYDKNFKIFLNAMPYAWLLAGLVAARAARGSGAGRAAVAALTVALCALGVASAAAEISPGRFSLRSRYPSHDLLLLGELAAKDLGIRRAIGFCRTHAGDGLPDCLEGVGTQTLKYMPGGRRAGTGGYGSLAGTCEDFDPADRPLCYRGVGWALNWWGRIGRPSKVMAACGSLAPFGEQCMRGYMIVTPDVIYNMPPRLLTAHLDEEAPEVRDAFGAGFGVFFARRFRADPGLAIDLCREMEREHGLEGCARSAARDLGWYAGRSWTGGVPRWLDRALLRDWSLGLGEMLSWLHRDDPGGSGDPCGRLDDPDAALGCEEGAAGFAILMDPARGAPVVPISASAR